MGTDKSRPPSQVSVPESDRIAAARAALEGAYDEARPHIMRWSVVTTALRDLVRARAQVDLSWVEIAHVATRWVEDLRTKGYSMAPEPSIRVSVAQTSQPTWIARNGFRALNVALGVVFIWFGLLKPFAESPFTDLVTKSLPFAPPALVLHVAGWWEVATGVCLLVPRFARAGVVLLVAQMPAILLPFVVLPDVCFAHVPYALTREGESLIKSLLLAVAAILGATSSASCASSPTPR